MNGQQIKKIGDERHILIIWPNSLFAYKTILKEVSSIYTVEEDVEIDMKNISIEWLGKFYARSLVHYDGYELLEILKSKKRQIGKGKARIMVVSCSNPEYDLVETTNGVMYVNRKNVELKKRLRNIISGDIHMSDSSSDSNDNRFHLKEYSESSFFTEIDAVMTNSIDDFFDYLDKQTINYVALRGSELVSKDTSLLYTHKKDIDLLVDSKDMEKINQYPFLTSLSQEKDERYTLVYTENSIYRSCKLDIYPTNAGLLPNEFESKILSEKERVNNVYKLNSKNQDMYDAYHYVFQKRYLPRDKKWNDKVWSSLVDMSIEKVLHTLSEYKLDQTLENQFYPNWKHFPGIDSLDRKPIHRSSHGIINGKRYFTYIFENKDGLIEKEGDIDCIVNESNILKILEKNLRTVPKIISTSTDPECSMALIKMTKVPGIKFRELSNTTWNLKKLIKHINSSAHTIKIFKKHNIVHRDINPSNIFFDDNDIFFIDFGWSIIKDTPKTIPTPAGLNKGFYGNPRVHDDEYSLSKCFITKYIFPPFIKRIFNSNDIEYIRERFNSLTFLERIITSLFLSNQKTLQLLAKLKQKIKK